MEAIHFKIDSEFGHFLTGKINNDLRPSRIFVGKTDILGILGATIGLEGFSQYQFLKKFNADPGKLFFEVLDGIEIAIIPDMPDGFKQISETFIHTNMKHINERGILNVTQHQLVKPSYHIYVKQGEIDDSTYEKIKDYILNEKTVFIPYMGKNNFKINVTEREMIELEEEQITTEENGVQIDSLVKVNALPEIPELTHSDKRKKRYLYAENVKVKNVIDKSKNRESLRKVEEKMIYTNKCIKIDNFMVDKQNDRKIVFF